jgi:hypothetical protein
MNMELDFVRVTSPEVIDIIPRELFEVFKSDDNSDADVDRWIAVAKMTIKNDLNYFHVISDGKGIVGVFWVVINLFDNHSFVRAMSVNKEYQSVKKGDILQAALNYWASLPFGEELNRKLVFATTRPSAYEKSAVKAKRSKQILMEVPYGTTE